MCVVGDSSYRKIKLGYSEYHNYHHENGEDHADKAALEEFLFIFYATLILLASAFVLAVIGTSCYMMLYQKKSARDVVHVIGRPVNNLMGRYASNNVAPVADATVVDLDVPTEVQVVEMIEQSSAPASAPPPRVIDPHLLDRLNDMGFDRRDAENKLLQANAFDVVDVSRAVEIIGRYATKM
jgi:hypothetical protein